MAPGPVAVAPMPVAVAPMPVAVAPRVPFGFFGTIGGGHHGRSLAGHQLALFDVDVFEKSDGEEAHEVGFDADDALELSDALGLGGEAQVLVVAVRLFPDGVGELANAPHIVEQLGALE